MNKILLFFIVVNVQSILIARSVLLPFALLFPRETEPSLKSFNIIFKN